MANFNRGPVKGAENALEVGQVQDSKIDGALPGGQNVMREVLTLSPDAARIAGRLNTLLGTQSPMLGRIQTAGKGADRFLGA